jgi:hypothetical protein
MVAELWRTANEWFRGRGIYTIGQPIRWFRTACEKTIRINWFCCQGVKFSSLVRHFLVNFISFLSYNRLGVRKKVEKEFLICEISYNSECVFSQFYNSGVWRSGLTHRILIPAFEGSNPSTPAIHYWVCIIPYCFKYSILDSTLS